MHINSFFCQLLSYSHECVPHSTLCPPFLSILYMHIMCFGQSWSPFPPLQFLPYPQTIFLANFMCLLFKSTESTLLPLKKTDSSSSRSPLLPAASLIGVKFYVLPTPMCAGSLNGIVSCRSMLAVIVAMSSCMQWCCHV